MRRVAVLGATGSIGTSALDVIRRHPDRFAVTALAAHRQVEPLLAAARELGVPRVALADEEAARAARARAWPGLAVSGGSEAVADLGAGADVDVVVNGLVGAAGLVPTLTALRAGRTVALANKESLVLAGELVTETARRHGGRILPVDSEHSGLFQILDGRERDGVRRLWLTASGGALRDVPVERVADASPDAVLAHPTWRMGRRITVDSATLLNKGFELIEARWLFDVPVDGVDVVLHPQSLVHALVELADGSLLAQLGAADMRLAIAYALAYPERLDPPAPPLAPPSLGALTFAAPDPARYPCLALARAAGERGGTAPAALNAADEEAVEAFLGGRIRFGDIPRLLERVLAEHASTEHPSLAEILAADAWARRAMRRYLS